MTPLEPTIFVGTPSPSAPSILAPTLTSPVDRNNDGKDDSAKEARTRTRHGSARCGRAELVVFSHACHAYCDCYWGALEGCEISWGCRCKEVSWRQNYATALRGLDLGGRTTTHAKASVSEGELGVFLHTRMAI